MNTHSGSGFEYSEKHPVILTVSDIVRIAAAPPDKQTTLAYELVAFGHLRNCEAIKLTVENFPRSEDGTPFEIMVPRSIAVGGEARVIPIRPNLAKILMLTLPKKGRLFTDQGVYRRIRIVAKSLGIQWGNARLRPSCATYALAAHARIYDVAMWSGYQNLSSNDHILLPVSFDDAKKYWQLTLDCARIASLPVHQKLKLKSPATQPTEPPPSALSSLHPC
jgi:integrase